MPGTGQIEEITIDIGTWKEITIDKNGVVSTGPLLKKLNGTDLILENKLGKKPRIQTTSKFKTPKLKKVNYPNIVQWEVGTIRQDDGYYRLTHLGCSGIIQVWIHPDKSIANDAYWLTHPYCVGCGRWVGKKLCRRLLRRYNPLKQPTTEGEAASICFIDDSKASVEDQNPQVRIAKREPIHSSEYYPDFSEVNYNDVGRPRSTRNGDNGRISHNIFKRGRSIMIAVYGGTDDYLLVAMDSHYWSIVDALTMQNNLKNDNLAHAQVCAINMCDQSNHPKNTIIVSRPIPRVLNLKKLKSRNRPPEIFI